MVKCLLSRQNTKPLKGYKMNPDTPPLFLTTDLLTRADIQDKRLLKLCKPVLNITFYLNRLF